MLGGELMERCVFNQRRRRCAVHRSAGGADSGVWHQCHNPTVVSFYGKWASKKCVETEVMDATLRKHSAAAAKCHVTGRQPCSVISRSEVFQTRRLETGSIWSQRPDYILFKEQCQTWLFELRPDRQPNETSFGFQTSSELKITSAESHI